MHVPLIRTVTGDELAEYRELGNGLSPDNMVVRWTATIDNLERDLRYEWWVNHGCPVGSQYGDDGEQSCGSCGLDFKRTPMSELRMHVTANRLAKGKEAMEAIQAERAARAAVEQAERAG